MAVMMFGSKLVASGTWLLIRLSMSIWQEPVFEIQILPVEEAWRSSSAVGASGHEGGRPIVRELDIESVRFGVFPATLMLPRSTEAVSIALPSKSVAWRQLLAHQDRTIKRYPRH